LDRQLSELGFAPVVVHLKVDYTGVIRRISGRRQCPVCGTVYSVSSNPPQGPDHCDRDGARLITRDDDREDVVRARLDAYERQTRPILEHYRASGAAFHEVDGALGGPDEVFALVCSALRV
jgi:adenylate kinase